MQKSFVPDKEITMEKLAARKIPELFRKDFPCNAAELVYRVAGSDQQPPEEIKCKSEVCGALQSALSLTDKKEVLRHEFITLTGAETCATLCGERCPYYIELSANLVNRYENQSGTGKPRVLLLGDSIRGNYENTVREKLANEFEVVSFPENGRFAKYQLNTLDQIFKTLGEPDVVHWNTGLWDSAIVCPEDGMFTKPEEYLYYMSRILRELRKHTHHIIFATTTPVKPGSLNQKIEYVDALNEIIVPFMQKENVRINDLYGLVNSQIEEYIAPDCIHLSPKGIEACSDAVVNAIRAEMN